MRAKSILVFVILTLAGAGLAPAVAVAEVPVPGTERLRVRYGLVGMTRLQSARLNVVAVGGGSPDPASCPVALGFVDTAGAPFTDASGAPIAGEVTLAPGVGAALNLRAADAFRGSSALRVQLRPTVRLIEPTLPPPEPCRRPVVTMEVIDTLTGRTAVLYFPTEPGE